MEDPCCHILKTSHNPQIWNNLETGTRLRVTFEELKHSYSNIVYLKWCFQYCIPCVTRQKQCNVMLNPISLFNSHYIF